MWLWPVRTPELNRVSYLARQSKDLIFHLIQHVLIGGQCGVPKWRWRGDNNEVCKCHLVFVFISKPTRKNRKKRTPAKFAQTLSVSSPLLYLFFALQLIHTSPSTGPTSPGRGSNIACFCHFLGLWSPSHLRRDQYQTLMSAAPQSQLHWWEMKRRNRLRSSPSFCLLSSVLLALLFCPRLPPRPDWHLARARVRNPAESSRLLWHQKTSMCFSVLWKAANTLHWQWVAFDVVFTFHIHIFRLMSSFDVSAETPHSMSASPFPFSLQCTNHACKRAAR